jgi:hypothetical protein
MTLLLEKEPSEPPTASPAPEASPDALASEGIEIGRLRPDEVGAVARVHHEFFGRGEKHGTTIANFGPEFLERVFYGLNVDNPYLFVDVARHHGQIIAFSVYASDGKRVFRETVRRHFFPLLWELARVGLRKPGTLVTHAASNLAFLREQQPQAIRGVRAWYFLLGVKPEFRTREFQKRTGIWIAGELWRRMEQTLREQGCDQFWTVVGAHNLPMNALHRRMQMELVATGTVQGLPSNYYRKTLAVSRPAK